MNPRDYDILVGFLSAVSRSQKQVFPSVFLGPGEAILRTALSRAESVGSEHLGFMEEVKTEMKVGHPTFFVTRSLIALFGDCAWACYHGSLPIEGLGGIHVVILLTWRRRS